MDVDKERRDKRDSGYDTWRTPAAQVSIVQMAESGRIKVKEFLSRHSELEQSETKGQVALITVLSLTQITELKLLLDIGRHNHRFYDFVLAMLICCICIEIFIGIIISYIGNLHYYQTSDGTGICAQLLNCITCWRFDKRRSHPPTRGPNSGGEALMGRSGIVPLAYPEDEGTTGCCGIRLTSPRLEVLDEMDRNNTVIEFARIRAADSNVRIARAANYVKVIEDAKKMAPGSSELDQELGRAREELFSVQREKEEADAESRLAEAQQHRAFFLKEQKEDRQEIITFRRVSYWQHMATYLLYFVMLLNVFITTFGISTGASHHPAQHYIIQQEQLEMFSPPSPLSESAVQYWGTPQR